MHPLILRPATSGDAEFLFQLLKATMREYVEQSWGWDEEWQRAYFQMRYDPSENQIIVLDGRDIGVIAAERREDTIHLSTIYIRPEYQDQGIGTQLLKDLLAEASREGLPVTLRVLRVNPAKRLYERLGFVVIRETETRYYMKAMPIYEQHNHDLHKRQQRARTSQIQDPECGRCDHSNSVQTGK